MKLRQFAKPKESLSKSLEKSQSLGASPLRRPNYKNEEETQEGATVSTDTVATENPGSGLNCSIIHAPSA